MVALRLTTKPAVEPLTLDQAKAHLRYLATDQDTGIAELIAQGRAACEAETNRALLTQGWTLGLERFPPGQSGIIALPKPPLQSVSAITYRDTNGEWQTLDEAEYQVDALSEPGRIAPARNCWWPDTDSESLTAVQISYVAGWATAADVPEQFIGALKLFVGYWFPQIEAVVTGAIATELPLSARWLLAQVKMPVIG